MRSRELIFLLTVCNSKTGNGLICLMRWVVWSITVVSVGVCLAMFTLCKIEPEPLLADKIIQYVQFEGVELWGAVCLKTSLALMFSTGVDV